MKHKKKIQFQNSNLKEKKKQQNIHFLTQNKKIFFIFFKFKIKF